MSSDDDSKSGTSVTGSIMLSSTASLREGSDGVGRRHARSQQHTAPSRVGVTPSGDSPLQSHRVSGAVVQGAGGVAGMSMDSSQESERSSVSGDISESSEESRSKLGTSGFETSCMTETEASEYSTMQDPAFLARLHQRYNPLDL